MKITPLTESVGPVGAKAERLRELALSGFPIPRAVVLTNLLDSDIHSFKRDLTQLLESTFSGRQVVARSSVSDEDRALALAPGVYDSFLGLTTAEALIHAIEVCRSGVYGADAIAYRELHKIDELPELAVVVQEMIPAERSGVLYTTDPLSIAPRMAVEWVNGIGTDVVLGRSTHRFTMERPERVVPVDDWSFEDVDELRDRLQRLGLMLENRYGQPQDIEWGVHEARLYLFQTRPAALGQPADQLPVGDRPMFDGISVAPVSLGYAIGRLANESDNHPAHLLHDPLIRLLDELPSAAELIEQSTHQGLIARRSNTLSHAAAMCRELGIPTVQYDLDVPSGMLALDAVRGVLSPFADLDPVERKRMIFGAMRTLASRHTTPDVVTVEDKYETILIDPFAVGRLSDHLTSLGVTAVTEVEDLVPYDQGVRQYTGISARAQQRAEGVRVQFKRAHNLPDRPMRFDQEVHVRVADLGEAHELLTTYGYTRFEAQQREVERWSVMDGTVMMFRWPNQGQRYVGIESPDPDWIMTLLSEAGVPPTAARAMDGTQIFAVAGIGLRDLQFAHK